MTTNASLWSGVDAYLDRLTNPELASAHLIGPLVARRWRQQGRSVAPLLEHEEQLATLANVLAPVLIRRIRASLDGPMMIFKGPEIAAEYPGSARLFSDVDVLVPDARAAQSALRAAGFVEVPDPRRPLCRDPPSDPRLAPERSAARGRDTQRTEMAVPAAASGDRGALRGRSSFALRRRRRSRACARTSRTAAGGARLGARAASSCRDVLDVAVAKEGLDANERSPACRATGGSKRFGRSTARQLMRSFGERPARARCGSGHGTSPPLASAPCSRTTSSAGCRRLGGLPLRAGLGHALRRMASDLQPAFDDYMAGRAPANGSGLRACVLRPLGAQPDPPVTCCREGRAAKRATEGRRRMSLGAPGARGGRAGSSRHRACRSRPWPGA